jgi:hypothetical protein
LLQKLKPLLKRAVLRDRAGQERLPAVPLRPVALVSERR